MDLEDTIAFYEQFLRAEFKLGHKRRVTHLGNKLKKLRIKLKEQKCIQENK